MSQVFQGMMGPFVSMTGSKKLTFLILKQSQEDMVFMKELLEAGKVNPVIDRSYTLTEVAEALWYYGEGHA